MMSTRQSTAHALRLSAGAMQMPQVAEHPAAHADVMDAGNFGATAPTRRKGRRSVGRFGGYIHNGILDSLRSAAESAASRATRGFRAMQGFEVYRSDSYHQDGRTVKEWSFEEDEQDQHSG